MALSFPSNPTQNQVYQAPNGVSYVWNGSYWAAESSGGGSGGGGSGSSGGGASVIFSNGYTVTNTATSINFVGDIVTATVTGTNVIVNFTDIVASNNSLGMVEVGAGLTIDPKGTLSIANYNWTAGTAVLDSTQTAVTYWTPNGAQFNIDAVIQPVGNGANLASTNGNKRGQYATDWQKVITSPTQVASGNYSVIGGGSLNSATNVHSVVVGGNKNLADAQWSTVLGGVSGSTRGITGATIISGAATNGARANPGQVQAGVYLLSAETYDNSIVTLTTDGTNSVSTSNQVSLPDNSAYHFKGTVIAKEYQAYRGQVWAWSFEGAIRRDVGSTTTDFSPSAIAPIVTQITNNSTSTGWAISLNINNALGSLTVQAQGQSSKHIRWACRIDTVEVTDVS